MALEMRIMAQYREKMTYLYTLSSLSLSHKYASLLCRERKISAVYVSTLNVS
jgi:hypothetical protein